MVIITSIYGVVDGVMVSNYVGTTSFAALNLIWPFIAILGSLGLMIGTGGSALVAKNLGEGNNERACNLFSMLTVTAIVVGVVMGVLGFLVVEDVAKLLGAEGEMLAGSVTYGSILLLTLPLYVMQVYFQSLLITAERPKLGMWITIGAGLLHILLDVIFVGFWKWGLVGAAVATSISELFGGGVPLIYFIVKRKSEMTLRLGSIMLDIKALVQTCFNGLSEFVMQISLSIVSMLYMYQLLRAAGENGVAAYGIMMYFAFTFVAVFIGYGIGCAPVVSYHYGANNTQELKSLLQKGLRLVGIGGIIVVAIAQILARQLCSIFVSYDEELLTLTIHAFRIYSLMFLVTGFNIFSSAFFTALNNGVLSAIISVLRTMVFEAGCVIVLPLIFGIEGIWWSVVVAETTTMLIAFQIIYKNRIRYGYY